MATRKLLFISGSLGLGHVTRDLAIANELRRATGEIDLYWLASGTAAYVLNSAGERLVDGASLYADENADAEKVATGLNVNLFSYLMKARSAWKRNASVFSEIVSANDFDLVIGDETYEVLLELRKHPDLKRWPFAVIFDFLGLDRMSRSPIEAMGVYIYNRMWSADYRKPTPLDIVLFVGEQEDIPNRKFGFMLPNRREYAKDRRYNFVGYILPFDLAKYSDPSSVKNRLGYGPGPLIICSIGGTAIGKELLELCAATYPILKRSTPELQMVLVCGPRLAPQSLVVPKGVEIRGYVPSLYEHFAACDIAVVQGGGTTTLELTALRRPFIYFPIEGHSEQRVVLNRLDRHQAGTRMRFSQTSADSLAEAIANNLNSRSNHPPVPVDGARKAAHLIAQLLA